MNDLQPILKWVGGKRQLINEIMPLIKLEDKIYVEPFLGGGAILFALKPKDAIIGDYNEELINVYKTIKENPLELIKTLEVHKEQHTKEHFYKIRELDRDKIYDYVNNVEKAARTIYLNKTCFNGLYRVNKSGYFNSPCGKYTNPNIINKETIIALSQYFNENNIKINCCDYREILNTIPQNAFVYLDPPYMPISKSSSFTAYTKNGFSNEQQILLKEECDKLRDKNIPFILSNSDCEEIRELYKNYDIKTIKAKRNINSVGDKRGSVNELLIYSILH